MEEFLWGHTFEWICGHQGTVIGPHDLSHPHHCPLCFPERDPECGIEYLDLH